MFDTNTLDVFERPLGEKTKGRRSPTRIFSIAKYGVDFTICLALLPLLCLLAAILWVLNPWFNPGPLFFAQTRMGQGCRPFRTIKFRTMQANRKNERGPEDPLETDRITGLGRFLRRARVDELPQIMNVLLCQMSLIGPRPDYFPHAQRFLDQVPGYRDRHAVRPGISGLAQTELGYAVGAHATAAKVRADLYYIQNAGPLLELWIVWRTLVTICAFRGQ